ncbi:MAG TPA: carbamoyltransferase HypF [Candidatus Paceibacterota bacterium]|nr:carbamoyltransferase HypF [Verrucomicrobiota bacterium]HRY51892.1 carbamoyltransferase HypF [Candidatus Paceibacterota bacterium]HSA00502.1 carbamoyltransferase HypF [Candidatus Paceibacterota bacterium]
MQRQRYVLRGVVQGVGFRPFVYRLAKELGLNGWVNNSAQGVFIEVEGSPEGLGMFRQRLAVERPPLSSIQSLECVLLDARGYDTFEIRSSEGGEKTAWILPDIATCAACRQEIFNPRNRRFRYPFTNCTHCGPRYSILESLPYDRVNTTMRKFTQCPACQAEYEDPANRRFHAQPNACPVCGPHLELWNAEGQVLASRDGALREAAKAVCEGRVVALKGLGGFQLLVDARQTEAVGMLRRRKQREEKPFALMLPSLEAVEDVCDITDAERALLTGPESPIVLLRRRPGPSVLSPGIAPGNPLLGIMLPYTPLHHLLLAELDFPVIATSGNLSDEPMCVDEGEALTRLRGIADYFLAHDRPVARPVDDSIVRFVADRELVLRRARGYAPLPIRVREDLPPLLAVGAHLKNTVATSVGRDVYVSQHIGDLESVEADEAFQRAVIDLPRLHELSPVRVACDAHPDYRSTLRAQQSGLPIIPVQHHYAHVCACMAENELEPPLLGVAWDGTGYGLDGTIWGGEFLSVTEDGFIRSARFRPFALPGGEMAIREPRRSALGILYEMLGSAAFNSREFKPIQAFDDQELGVLKSMLEQRIRSPRTSSVGRLFDGVSALIGLRQKCRFEGQAAMELEFALDGIRSKALYPVSLANETARWHEPISLGGLSAAGDARSRFVVDWEPMIWAILEDVRHGTSAGLMAARFHNTLAEVVAAVAGRLGEDRVVLSGGCFQNAYLVERTVERLRSDGVRVYWHQRVPPNDGGIALGQVVAAGRVLKGN